MFGWLTRKPPAIPKTLNVFASSYFLDGGTLEIWGFDEVEQKRCVRLTQHMFEQRGGVGWLYLDRYRIRRRSAFEREVVALLEEAAAKLMKHSEELRSWSRPKTLSRTDRLSQLMGGDGI